MKNLLVSGVFKRAKALREELTCVVVEYMMTYPVSLSSQFYLYRPDVLIVHKRSFKAYTLYALSVGMLYLILRCSAVITQQPISVLHCIITYTVYSRVFFNEIIKI